MFSHYIITRFNLRRADWTATRDNDSVLSEDWMKSRFELFENYCFPSVKNQKNQNFKWFVFFDINTSEVYRKRIKKLQEEFSNFVPFFIDKMDAFLPSIKKEVIDNTTSSYVITSRLDNDDCIHEEYVEVVQSTFDNQEYMAIDVLDGYIMEMGEKVKIGKKRHIYNPYISLIEKTENFESVWSNGHTYWKYETRITFVKGPRMWLTVIHEKNKANTFLAYGKVDTNVLRQFNVTDKVYKLVSENYMNLGEWWLNSLWNRIRLFFKHYGKLFKRWTGIYNIKKRFEQNDYD